MTNDQLAALDRAATQGLLPCPFCGGEAMFQETHRSHWRVACSQCGLKHPTLVVRQIDPRPALVAAWNTRTGKLVLIGPDAVEVVADAMRAVQANNRTWTMEALATAALAALGVK